MPTGIFNPRDDVRASTTRPARVDSGAAVRKWYADGIFPYPQDFNDLVAQLRAAGDAYAIPDSEGDDNYLLKVLQAAGREKLTAARTYYVRTDGSDSNTGLTDNAGGAFLTINKAIEVALSLNFNRQTVTIQVRDGTRTEAVAVRGPIVGLGTLILRGNTTTPANCVLSPSTGAALSVSNWGIVAIEGFKFVSADNAGVSASNYSYAILSALNDFGACSTHHILAQIGSRVVRSASYTVSGAASRHLRIFAGSQFEGAGGTTVTLSGTPAFSTAFADLSRGSSYLENNAAAYSGAATGLKYIADTDCSMRGPSTIFNMNDILPGDKLGAMRPTDGEARLFRNLLYNASGRLQDGSAAAVGDDAYGLHNRWFVLSQAGTVTPSTVSDVADGVPSLIRLTNSHGSPQRMGYAQILPAHASRPLRGRRLSASLMARISAASNIRFSVLSWAGTGDVLTSDIVNSWTSTTYTVGNFFTNPGSLSVLMAAGYVPPATDTLYNITGTTFTVDVPSDCNNLIVFVHPQSSLVAGTTFDFRAQLELGAVASNFEVRPMEMEESLCAPFYQKKTVRSENGSRHIPLVKMRAVPSVAVSVGSATDRTADGFELSHTSAADCAVTATAEL